MSAEASNTSHRAALREQLVEMGIPSGLLPEPDDASAGAAEFGPIRQRLRDRYDAYLDVIHADARVLHWCEPDDCPAAICGGPHRDHECGDSIVTSHIDDETPCLFCGHTFTEEIV